MAMQFKKAERKRSKLRLALAGPSGSGKTYGALLIAKGIGGKIAVIDTEQGSASLYSHIAEYDALELSPPYTPERYIEAINAAVAGGYSVLIIDSMTHEWDGAGGCLESNERLAHARFKGNTWAAWNETTPRHRSFVDAILQAPIHIIATMRSKTETVQNDQKKVVKLGMKTVQRDGTDYEFTTVLDLTHENHYANSSKDRTGLFSQPEILSEATGKRLAAWLDSGAELKPEAPRPSAVPTAELKAELLRTGWGWANAIDAMNRNNGTSHSITTKPDEIDPAHLLDFYAWLKSQPDATGTASTSTTATASANDDIARTLRAAIDTAKSAAEFDAAAKLLADNAGKITPGTKLQLEARLFDLRKEFESGETHDNAF